jgi:hypothetical protein
MTEAAVASPGERAEDVIYPAVPGGGAGITVAAG